MKYLLDTHVLLWTLMSRDKLSSRVKDVLGAEHDMSVSTVSLWEISLKYSIGKLELKGKVPDQVPEAMGKMGFDVAGLSPEIVSSQHKLPIFHQDPFDRMLIWQAINEDFIMISKDKDFSKYKKHGLKLVW